MKQPLKEIFERITFFIRRIARIQKQIKKARKAKRDFPIQAEVAKKLDQYVADFLSGKIEKVFTVAKKPELVGGGAWRSCMNLGSKQGGTERLYRLCV